MLVASIAILAAIALAHEARAVEVTGRVVRIADGDTLKALARSPDGNAHHEIRLQFDCEIVVPNSYHTLLTRESENPSG